MVQRLVSLFICLACGVVAVSAQPRDTLRHDSARAIKEVVVNGYLSPRPVLKVPASVGVLSAQQLGMQSDVSLVSAMNTLPGVRMEERSPGSYRLSIRGSLLRSPFGVRDVKVYFDGIPLTDAGGNTYLNAVDINSIKKIEILKGPDGSLFGANSGGVVILSPVDINRQDNYLAGSITGGSYTSLHQSLALQQVSGNNKFNLSQAYQTYGGYRKNSAMQRNYLQATNQFTYGKTDHLTLLGFYSALNYQTPGGLTQSQLASDPSAARPQSKIGNTIIGSATDLNASVNNKMLFGGAENQVHLSNSLDNFTSIFGTHVSFANPSFTTYEQRQENTYGLRSYFTLSGNEQVNFTWKASCGIEWQQTNSAVSNYGNRAGNRDTAQSIDNIRTNQSFIFTRFEASLLKRWVVEAALSLNNYQYQFQNVYPLAQAVFTSRPFTAQLMPRLALSYQVTNNFVWRASVSRGYSTPTISEVRGTDHTINTQLQAQDGWNYETGLRLRNADETFLVDASVFYYRLNNAIVQRTHSDETTFYINAGGTNQPGAEVLLSYWLVTQRSTGIVRGIQLSESYTYSKFTFASYIVGANDYRGNNLTGVPRQVIVSSVNILAPHGLYIFVQHNFTDRLPLNDANTYYAGSYHLLDARVGYKLSLNKRRNLEAYAAAYNLLAQHYSLGNDLNAAGNRFYNPAPLLNYALGLSFRI
jgi:iron complex outermembrane receptor protein